MANPLINVSLLGARRWLIAMFLVVPVAIAALACASADPAQEPAEDPEPTSTPTSAPVSSTRTSTHPGYTDLPVTWVRQFGSRSTDLALDIALDAEDNIYVTGTTAGAFPEQDNIGSRDSFIQRYNPDGSSAWVVQLGTEEADIANGISINPDGEIYVVGSTTGELSPQPNAGGKDAFVEKLDSSGEQIWIAQFGTAEEDEAFKVAVGGSGNIAVVGVTSGVLPEQGALGNQDIFLTVMDPDSHEVWTVQMGTDEDDMAHDVSIDGEGNVYIAGTVGGALPGQSAYGVEDAFVRKYDPLGAEIWTVQFGTFRKDDAFAIAVDGEGNVYVGGGTSESLGDAESAGGADAFLRKYDSTGSLLWTLQFGSNSEDEIRDLTIGADGTIQAAGWTLGIIVARATAVGADSFLTTYDPSGAELTRIQLTSTPFDKATGIASATSGEIYITGRTEDALPTQRKLGSTDAFIVQVVLE